MLNAKSDFTPRHVIPKALSVAVAIVAFTFLAQAQGDAVLISDFIPPDVLANVRAGQFTQDVSSSIQSAVDAAQIRHVPLQIPCGLYPIGKTLLVGSNVVLRGKGPCAVFKALPTLPSYRPFTEHTQTEDMTGVTQTFIVTNRDYQHGNDNIEIQDLAFDMSDRAVAGSTSVHFRNVRRIRIIRVSTRRGNDGIAFTKSSDVLVTQSHITGHDNAGIDIWDGSHDFEFSENDITGLGSGALASGVQITGLSTRQFASPVGNGRVLKNRISAFTGNGIWVQGGYANRTNQTGSASDVSLDNNIIDTVIQYHGIRVSEAKRITITGNNISNVAKVGIIGIGERPGAGAGQDILVERNTIINNAAARKEPAIYFGPGARTVTIDDAVIGSLEQVVIDTCSSGIKVANAVPIYKSSDQCLESR